MKTLEVFATTSFSYVQDSDGHLYLADKNRVHSVPGPVAAHAVASEAALAMTTPEGQAAYQADQRARLKPKYRGDRSPLAKLRYWPLGDVMGLGR